MRECTATANTAGEAVRPGLARGHHRGRPMLATALLLALVLVATALSAGTSAPIAGPGAVPAPPLARSDAAAWAQVPALARLAISRGIGADQSAYWVTPARDGLSARNPT